MVTRGVICCWAAWIGQTGGFPLRIMDMLICLVTLMVGGLVSLGN